MRRRRARAAPWLITILWALGSVGAVLAGTAGRVPLTADTEVRAIRFVGVHALEKRRLERLLRTRHRGSAYGLRRGLGRLPLVPSPAPHPFRPRVLQEDVVRLRNEYLAAGFLGTNVRYDVQRIGDEDLLDITFIIEEGTPQRVAAVTIAAADSLANLPVPPDLHHDWIDRMRHVERLAGQRLDVVAAVEQRERLRGWWADAGYPWAAVDGRVRRDSLRHEARIHYTIAPGPRCRFGPITVRGNRTLSGRSVRSRLPFRPGDRYSEVALRNGRRQLEALQIVRSARVEIPTGRPAGAAAPDAALPIAVTLSEFKPRVVSGQLGYVTDAGLSGEARWSHRDFAGDGRVITMSGLTQTGVLAAEDDPDIRHRGTVSLQQSQLLRSNLSGFVSPFIEYREDRRDRSLETGTNLTLVFRPRAQLSGSLDYRIATRRIYEYRLGDVIAGDVDLLTLLARLARGELDSLGTQIRSSLLTLSITTGTLDDLAQPRRGVLVRPTLQVTAPTAWSSSSYWRADCSGYAFVPLAHQVTAAARLTAGHLFPFGQSLPDSSSEALLRALELRDASFTAGGSSDVRGWAHRMLGPKFPDIRFTEEGDSLAIESVGYVPVGGFSRVSFSLELRLPLPPFGPRLGSHLFLDGGRVWTGDRRFDPDGDSLGQERLFLATGAGVDIRTPVGSIRGSLGYKLNPSLLDLVDAGDLYRALLDGTPLEQLRQHNGRRWQFNLALGASY